MNRRTVCMTIRHMACAYSEKHDKKSQKMKVFVTDNPNLIDFLLG